MLFTCKRLIFSNFTWKKIAPGNDGGTGTSRPLFFFSTALILRLFLYFCSDTRIEGIDYAKARLL